MYSYDAEALSGWRLHHHPPLQAIDNLRAQRLKACDFSGYVVALNIDVNATFMLDALDLDNGFVEGSLQHVVLSASAGVTWIQGTTQRPAPEVSSFLYRGVLAVDENGAEAGTVHNSALSLFDQTMKSEFTHHGKEFWLSIGFGDDATRGKDATLGLTVIAGEMRGAAA